MITQELQECVFISVPITSVQYCVTIALASLLRALHKDWMYFTGSGHYKSGINWSGILCSFSS